ncbi:MAG: rRNA maturation protein [Archaeoglobus sp.]|nr:rRNA maturation protein [Archaeoglobus sp.]
MIVTTSRKPGRKTRSFVKILSAYMNWKYVPRGKMSLEEIFSISPEIALVEEIKGNPSILRIFKNSLEVLRLRFNLAKSVKVKMDDSPVFFSGKLSFDPSLLGAVPSNIAGEKIKRKIKARGEIVKEVIAGKKKGRKFLNFTYRGKTVIFLYLDKRH